MTVLPHARMFGNDLGRIIPLGFDLTSPRCERLSPSSFKKRAVEVNRCICFLGTILWAIGVFGAQVAEGQTRFYPSRPTFSPWLYLYRGQTGPLDPYNAWVRPQMEYQDAMRAIERRFREQETSINRLRQENQLLRESTLPPTGVGSRFMDYSHFYGGGGASVRRESPSRLQIGSSSRLSNIADRYKRVY
jgi:hypothetical protein